VTRGCQPPRKDEIFLSVVVEIGHCHQPASGEGSEVSHYGVLVSVIGSVSAIAELLDRFSRANAGPPIELTAPVDLDLTLRDHRFPTRSIKLAICWDHSSSIRSFKNVATPKTTR
jgi:hypothetical protein